jgi:hypothetical protein
MTKTPRSHLIPPDSHPADPLPSNYQPSGGLAVLRLRTHRRSRCLLAVIALGESAEQKQYASDLLTTRYSGYFPLHEDPKSRIHRPHPFHLDARQARHRSISTAGEAAASQSTRKETLTLPTMPHHRTSFPALTGTGPAQPLSDTPVASYLPSGVHDTPLPMGKYYPTNYEQRNNQGPRSAGSSGISSPVKPGSQGQARPGSGSSTSRIDSDAKRRLQQYQRDMIAQASLAARELLNGSDMPTGAPTPLTDLKTFNLGSGSMAPKPESPRLIPLGSPGPVTPMDLDPAGGGYLDQGRGLVSPELVRRDEEMARAIRADEERRRREGGSSPAIEL